MGNAQQKHQGKGKQKGAKQDGRKTLQEAFQMGDDTFERIEKEEVQGVDPLGNEAAALDDLVERLDSFSVPRKPVPPPVLNRNLLEEEFSLPLSFSSGFQPGECSKNVKEAPEESSNDAPSVQERVTEISEFTGDKDDEEPLKDMDKAESSAAAESKVGQDAAESEAELDLPVTGVKLVDGKVEIGVELPETAAPSEEPVTDSVTEVAENSPIKATGPQDWSGIDTSGDAAESEFEVELLVTGVKPVGDNIEVEVELPEIGVPPEEAPLRPVTDSVPSVAHKGAENLPVKATGSQDWSERPLDTTKTQETESGREAGKRSEDISFAKTSGDKKDGAWLEQPAVPEKEVTGPERSSEAGEMIVQQAERKDIEEFKKPVAEGARTETTGTADNIHEEAAMTIPRDRAQEPSDGTESTSLQYATSEIAAGEHVEKQPHEEEEAGQEGSDDSRISPEETRPEDGVAFAESQDELRSHFTAAGDEKALQAEDENVLTEKTEEGEASVKDENLDTSGPVEVSDQKQSGLSVDGEETEEADGRNGQAGTVLDPEQVRDLIPEADDGSVPANEDQVADAAVVEDFKAEEVVRAAQDAKDEHGANMAEAEPQVDSEDSSTNERNQESPSQTDGLEDSKNDEEVAASDNKGLKDDEGATGPVTQDSEEFKLPEPEMELAPQVQRSAEFKDALELGLGSQASEDFDDALELGSGTQVSEDFKDAVSELESQSQKEVENAEEAAQGSGGEPELEQTPEVQGLKPEFQSLEDLQDAEPVFETPRAVEGSETELAPAPVESSEEVEKSSREGQTEQAEHVQPALAGAMEQVDESREGPVTEQAGRGRSLDVQGSNEAETAGPVRAEQTEQLDVSKQEPGTENKASVTERAEEFGVDKDAKEAARTQVQGPEAEDAKPDANLEEDEPVNHGKAGDGGSGSQPEAREVQEQPGTTIKLARYLLPQWLVPSAGQEVSQQEPPADEGFMRGESEASASQSVVAEESKPQVGQPASSESHTSQSGVDFDEREDANEAAETQVQGAEAKDAKPDVNLEEDEQVEEQPGTTSRLARYLLPVVPKWLAPSAPEGGQEVSQQDPPTEKADEGSLREESEASASQVVVAEESKPQVGQPASSESHASQPETAKERNDEAEAAESGALVLEPGMSSNVEPVVSELKSEPKLIGETGLTNEEPSSDEHGHSRSVESLEAGYQEPASSKINKGESESSAATAEVAAEVDSSETEELPEESSAAAGHALVADSYEEPDPDDSEEAEAEAKPREPESFEEPVAGLVNEPGKQSRYMQVGEEQSSSPRVKLVPGYDVAEDLHSNSEVPAFDVITQQKEAPSSSSIEAIANEEVVSKMDNDEPVKAGKAQNERVEVPGNVAELEVL